MRKLNLREIKQLESGEIIPSFSGHVEKVYEQKTGQGEYGPWYLQNMIVSDGTDKVQVTWGGEDDVSSLEGKDWLFESTLTSKHGLQGIKWDVRRSNGKTYEGVKLTASCKIKPADNSVSNDKLIRQMDIQDKGLHGGVGEPQNAEPSTSQGEFKPSEDRQYRIERQSARRDAVAFHALQCAAGEPPSLNKVEEIMVIMEGWLNG